jgi:ribosomal protein S18 acetylase RimI-like enzyme
MNITITRDCENIRNAAKFIEKLSNAERRSFGFIPRSAFLSAISNKNVLFAYHNNILAGYLLFSINYSKQTAKIIQTCVDPIFRKTGIGKELISNFILYCKDSHFKQINFKCAIELDANSFWQSLNFKILKRYYGRGEYRVLNYYGMHLQDSNSLFTISNDFQIHIAIDTCAFLNLIKKRKDDPALMELVEKSNSGHIKISKTLQLEKELKNHANGLTEEDPAYLKIQQLNTIPVHRLSEVKKIEQEILNLLFKETDRENKNNIGDAAHLSYAICGGATHFVTYDKHLLRNKKAIAEKFGAQVVLPYEALEEVSELSPVFYEPVILDAHDIFVKELSGRDHHLCEAFIKEFHLEWPIIEEYLTPNAAKCLKAFGAFFDDKLIGVLSIVERNGEVDIPLLYISSSFQNSGIVEFLVYKQIISSLAKKPKNISVSIYHDQEWMIASLNQFGFYLEKTVKAGDNVHFILKKPLYYNHITDQTINDAKSWVINNWGTKVDAKHLFDNPHLLINHFAPANVVLKGMHAVITPIEPKWASRLFAYSGEQTKLYNQYSEPFFRTENIYYRSALQSSSFTPGTLLLFYVSHNPKAITAKAIVTNSYLDTWENLFARFQNIGVFSEKDLKQIKPNKEHIIHAFTFNWIVSFKNPVTIDQIRLATNSKTSCVGPLKITAATALKIIDKGFA